MNNQLQGGGRGKHSFNPQSHQEANQVEDQASLPKMLDTREVVEMIKNANLYDLINISLRANEMKDETVEQFIHKALNMQRAQTQKANEAQLTIMNNFCQPQKQQLVHESGKMKKSNSQGSISQAKVKKQPPMNSFQGCRDENSLVTELLPKILGSGTNMQFSQTMLPRMINPLQTSALENSPPKGISNQHQHKLSIEVPLKNPPQMYQGKGHGMKNINYGMSLMLELDTNEQMAYYNGTEPPRGSHPITIRCKIIKLFLFIPNMPYTDIPKSPQMTEDNLQQKIALAMLENF